MSRGVAERPEPPAAKRARPRPLAPGPAVVADRRYHVPLPPGHRFPMGKAARVVGVVVGEGLVAEEHIHRPRPAPRAWLERVHQQAYVARVLGLALSEGERRRLGLPLSAALVRRSLVSVGGSALAARLALRHGLALNAAGGSHHAFPGFGAGFCLFNDLAVAARLMRDEGLAARVLVLDLDVHQGDGTAEIFRDDPAVFTFSVHCADNYPRQKRKSDLDIALPAGTGDGRYLACVEQALAAVLARVHPDLVLYNAGVDVHRDDRLGKLALSDAGILARERLVLSACRRAGAAVACVLGGGYADDLDVLARRHALLFRAAAEICAAPAAPADAPMPAAGALAVGGC